jgi:hypothetical protein
LWQYSGDFLQYGSALWTIGWDQADNYGCHWADMWLLLWWLLLQLEKCQLWPCWRTVIQIQRLYLVSKHWSGEELYAASFLPMCCNPFSILLLQCMVIARKKAAKFPFNNPLDWCPANILDNALHLVSEWNVNSYFFHTQNL